MNWATPAPYVMGALIGFVAFLIGRGIFREFRTALKRDDEEKTTKYFKGKLAEYGIVLAVGLIALIGVSYLKAGPLKGWSEQLYGKQLPTIDSPFHQGGKQSP
jgi:hypothetical protein